MVGNYLDTLKKELLLNSEHETCEEMFELLCTLPMRLHCGIQLVI